MQGSRTYQPLCQVTTCVRHMVLHILVCCTHDVLIMYVSVVLQTRCGMCSMQFGWMCWCLLGSRSATLYNAEACQAMEHVPRTDHHAAVGSVQSPNKRQQLRRAGRCAYHLQEGWGHHLQLV